jgi:hypothetical protein
LTDAVAIFAELSDDTATIDGVERLVGEFSRVRGLAWQPECRSLTAGGIVRQKHQS